ncbi:hypothetical protein [Streptomyces sp. H27-C3]|uniref:hypothetical protein n=1 Tax=Streptomyces sp. H27-C3 TaxID=3046305 RepID=UPI0024BA25EB|nr:hypothetical protein [Streptomyces sp. H27-C3]MDJ0464877.1 hypothetical protein [Streptomyces sp. H27-C3]
MNTGVKIAAFATALAATFGTAYGVGQGIGPVVAKERPAAEHGEHEGSKPGEGAAEKADAAAPETPGGLQVAEGGYALALETPRIEAGDRTELRFSIKDKSGRNVTAYQREHGKELHFIVASRDLTVYRHLHPTRAADGTWSTPAELPAAGGYRVFADFKPAKQGAEGVTLGADLAVGGDSEPAGLPPVKATAEVDGYEVTLAGGLRPGAARELKLSVAKDGKAVTDLQPYLGAYGHLVALRSGDLAYLHVHPNGEPGDGVTKAGPEVSFTATAPSSGAYRLFLDFQHEGKVRTAAFTVNAGGAAEPGKANETDKAEKGESGDHAH